MPPRLRFSILRPKLLSVMDLLLTDEGRILDVGCGFGLFAAYFGQTQPRRQIVGVDPNCAPHRARASRVPARSPSTSTGFSRGRRCGASRSAKGRSPQSTCSTVMHHIPEADQLRCSERLRDLLARPRCILLIKDITTRAALRLLFTTRARPAHGGDRGAAGLPPSSCLHRARCSRPWVSKGSDRARAGHLAAYPHVVIAATKL